MSAMTAGAGRRRASDVRLRQVSCFYAPLVARRAGRAGWPRPAALPESWRSCGRRSRPARLCWPPSLCGQSRGTCGDSALRAPPPATVRGSGHAKGCVRSALVWTASKPVVVVVVVLARVCRTSAALMQRRHLPFRRRRRSTGRADSKTLHLSAGPTKVTQSHEASRRPPVVGRPSGHTGRCRCRCCCRPLARGATQS